MFKKSKQNSEVTEEGGKRSKRKSEGKVSRSSFSKFCAFWGITLAALLFATNGLLQFLNKVFLFNPEGLDFAMKVIDFVTKLALLFAVGIPAYGYVYKKRLAWKIIYIIAVVFYACFCIYRLF